MCAAVASSSTASSTGKTVVITGSTKGLGYALAEEYMRYGDRVVVTSRRQENVDHAVSMLRGNGSGRVEGCVCDVSKGDDVERLGNFAVKKFGALDVWINNAGSVGKRGLLVEEGGEALEEVIGANLLGVMLGCRVAMRIMSERNGGVVWNVDGSGSFGNATPKRTAYGATKRAIPQLMKSLVKETKSMKGSPVSVNTFSPGMVLTDLLLGGDLSPRTKKIFNFLAEEPDTVAEAMVPKLRKVRGSGGKYYKYLGVWQVIERLGGGFLFGKRKNRFFDENGARVRLPGYQYNENGVRSTAWDMKDEKKKR